MFVLDYHPSCRSRTVTIYSALYVLETYDPAGGSGTDTSPDVAIALPSGKQIVGYDGGFIRNLLIWNNNCSGV